MIAQRVARWGYPFVLASVFGTGTDCTKVDEKPSGAIPADRALASQESSEDGPRVTGQPSPERFTRGSDSCPSSDTEMTDCGTLLYHEEPETCETHQRVTCEPECHGYTTQRYVCDRGKWRLRDKHQPACKCAPKKPVAELDGCSTNYVSVIPDVSLTDGCMLGFRCDGIDLWVECDAENDGTNTSLCECWGEGQPQRISGRPYPGEGPDACFAAAVACIKSADIR